MRLRLLTAMLLTGLVQAQAAEVANKGQTVTIRPDG